MILSKALLCWMDSRVATDIRASEMSPVWTCLNKMWVKTGPHSRSGHGSADQAKTLKSLRVDTGPVESHLFTCGTCHNFGVLDLESRLWHTKEAN